MTGGGAPRDGRTRDGAMAAQAWGRTAPSWIMNTATAAPAEWVTIPVGLAPTASMRSVTAAAMVGSAERSVGGAEVKAWPGRSGATTRYSRLSEGSRPAQLWLDPPAPWSNRRSGPSPAITTRQDRPEVSMIRLEPTWGHPAESRPHRSRTFSRSLIRRSARARGPPDPPGARGFATTRGDPPLDRSDRSGR